MSNNDPFDDIPKEKLLQSLENIGFDIECAACCMTFFTGYGGDNHTCDKSSILQQIKDAINNIDEIFNSNLDWDAKYNIIFELWSNQSLMVLEYYDPDTTYQEGVTALHTAIMDKYGTT